MEMNGKEQRHRGGGVGGGESLSKTSSSSDLNHSSSSNSNSVSLSHSQSQYRQQGRQDDDDDDPMQSWWESVSKARSRIRSLVSLLPPSLEESLSSLADSDRPARALLGSHSAYLALSSSLSGSGDDPLCHWLYDTFQDDVSDLRLVVLSLVPLLSGLYLSRVHSSSTTTPSPGSPSLAGFEAVLLALYSSQTKSRAGKPLLVSVPTPAHLSDHPSLYHHPAPAPAPAPAPGSPPSAVSVAALCPPLEPQVGIKSTKRTAILGVALHCFYSHISLMPSWSKLELCHFAASWAGHLDVPPAASSDILLLQDPLFSSASNANANADGGVSIPLPWELLQPLLRILAHCLLAPPPLVPHHVSDSASVAISRLYARASHDLSPQAILATRALLQLHTRARAAAAAAAAFTDASSIPATPTSINKIPDTLLLSN